MIAFYPIISTVKDHTSFFEVSTILIVYFFSRCLESISDFFFLLLIGCSGSLSMGAFLSRQARSQFFFFFTGRCDPTRRPGPNEAEGATL